jgi:hypothetical protein
MAVTVFREESAVAFSIAEEATTDASFSRLRCARLMVLEAL